MSFVLFGIPEFLGYIYLYHHNLFYNLAFRGHGIPKQRGGWGHGIPRGFEEACNVEIPEVALKKKEEFSGVFKKNL